MQVKTQLDDLQNYLADASNMQGGHAEKLFIPEAADEVANILREANEQRVAVTISGARTGTVGGAIPFGGIVISLERLRELEIDTEAMTATVGAGVILADLQKAYPPDPTEWSCQIGGTVATNASGAKSFKYGPTRNFVQRLQVIMASGEILDIRRGEYFADGDGSISIGDGTVKAPTYPRPDVRKNVSGYFNAAPLDAIDLFIGSEGTLGVITEVELSLLPKPEGFFSGIVFFKEGGQLLAFVDEVKRTVASYYLSSPVTGVLDRPVFLREDSAIDPSLLEYFDANALEFISEKFPETPHGMSGAIFFEQETHVSDEDERLGVWYEVFERYGADLDLSWFTTNDQDREKMRAFRHALPVAVNERISKYGQRKVGTDMAVPDANFASFLQYYKETLDTSGLDYVIFGHIGDCHLHANMLPKNADESEKARHIYGRCVAQAIMLGGTVSAEHGIGKLKRKYLAAMMGERYLNEMADLKKRFDPNGILSRGNMFDEAFL